MRTERAEDGLAELRRAAELAPDNPRIAYVVGVALHSLGQVDAALQTLGEARRRFVQDFDIGWALATMLRDNGDIGAAREVVEELARQRPGDVNVRALRDSLAVPQR